VTEPYPNSDDGDVEKRRSSEISGLLQAKNPEGLTKLLEHYGGPVLWYLRREFGRTLDDSLLDEALHTAVHDVWRSASTFDPARGTVRSWFYRVARNAALKIVLREGKWRKPQAAGVELESLATASAPLPSPAEPAPSAPDPFREDLMDCIAGLAPLQRQIVTADLASNDALSARELAEQLGSTQNAVYVARSKARDRLRKCLKAKGHAFGDSPPTDPHAPP